MNHHGIRLPSLTLSLWRDVHPVLDLHVSAEVPLQVELTGAVRTLEGFAASVEMHVAQQVVHSVERLATHLGREEVQDSATKEREELRGDRGSGWRQAWGCWWKHTLHLNGLTGRWTIMCVLRVCFWMKLLKHT